MKLNWTYRECLYFVDALKEDYEDVMHSFNFAKNKWEIIERARKIKKIVYDLEMDEWRKDKLWEYMNDDITYDKLWEWL